MAKDVRKVLNFHFLHHTFVGWVVALYMRNRGVRVQRDGLLCFSSWTRSRDSQSRSPTEPIRLPPRRGWRPKGRDGGREVSTQAYPLFLFFSFEMPAQRDVNSVANCNIFDRRRTISYSKKWHVWHALKMLVPSLHTHFLQF